MADDEKASLVHRVNWYNHSASGLPLVALILAIARSMNQCGLTMQQREMIARKRTDALARRSTASMTVDQRSSKLTQAQREMILKKREAALAIRRTKKVKANRLAALDVGIKSTEATGAGEDCAEAMVQEKLQYYADVLPELERKGITYAPITFSCFGRRHGTTTTIMTQVARRAARFRGQSDYKQLLRRWQATVTTEIWRRAARMVRKCFPPLGRDGLKIVGEGG